MAVNRKEGRVKFYADGVNRATGEVKQNTYFVFKCNTQGAAKNMLNKFNNVRAAWWEDKFGNSVKIK